MKTIKISRQGFSTVGMHSWIRFFIFILSKKYNVIIDAKNPDIIFYSNLYYVENDYDTFLKSNCITHDISDKNKKFIYVSGETADFLSPITQHNNLWSIGYNNFEHKKYLRMPSYVIDVWTLFDEARIYDAPFSWLTETRNFDKIKQKHKGFCSITQASDVAFRGLIVDKLQEYKQVTSSGPWRMNISPEDSFDKNIYLNPIYSGRIDGLTYRQKIEFFSKFKFNIAIHLTNTDYIVQEKLIHAYASGAVPIFYGNKYIEYDGFNPETLINLHHYENNLDEFLDLVKQIDSNDDLYKHYITKPIFTNNKLPKYFDIDYILSFLEMIVES